MESGIPYKLVTPLGTLTFNEYGAPSYLHLTDVTGLEGSEVRTSRQDKPHRRGTKRGASYEGGLYPLLEGQLVAPNPAARHELAVDLERHAYAILDEPGHLQFLPPGEHEWRQVEVYLNERLDVKGGRLKTFQLPLMSEDPTIYGAVEHVQAFTWLPNTPPPQPTNPSFATDITGWTASDLHIERVTSPGSVHSSGGALKVEDVAGTTKNSYVETSIPGTFNAGRAYHFDWYFKGAKHKGPDVLIKVEFGDFAAGDFTTNWVRSWFDKEKFAKRTAYWIPSAERTNVKWRIYWPETPDPKKREDTSEENYLQHYRYWLDTTSVGDDQLKATVNNAGPAKSYPKIHLNVPGRMRDPVLINLKSKKILSLTRKLGATNRSIDIDMEREEVKVTDLETGKAIGGSKYVDPVSSEFWPLEPGVQDIIVISQGPLEVPQVVSASVVADGNGVLAAGTYTYAVTAISTDPETRAALETTVGNSVQLTVLGPPNEDTIQVTWEPVEGATAYQIYLNGAQLLVRVKAPITSYTHTGREKPITASPPGTNNTGTTTPAGEIRWRDAHG